MSKALIIEGINIKPGDRIRLELKVAKLFDHTEMTIPVEVIRGKEDGPKMFISAAIHGDELNGVEVIKRLLAHKKILSHIKGTLIAVPIVNMFGFNRNVRYLPDRRDLNRVFPGSKRGSLAAQIAYKFMNEIVKKCNYGIDLHTGSAHRYNLPQIRTFLNNPEIKSLAESFGVPVVLNSNIRDGSLRQAAIDENVKILLFEGGEALRHDEKIIKSAENGIIATLSNIGMLDKKIAKDYTIKKSKIFYANSSYWVRAPHSGSMRIRKKVGNKVEENEILAMISDPFGITKYPVKSRKSGIIIGITRMPLVNNGDALFHIATFDNTDSVAKEIDIYNKRLQ